MPSFGRWQRARDWHPCAECGKDIEPGEVYMRLAYVAQTTWDRIVGPEEKRLYAGDPVEANLRGFTVRKLWAAALADHRQVLQTIHRRCWLGKADDIEFTQRSASVAEPALQQQP